MNPSTPPVRVRAELQSFTKVYEQSIMAFRAPSRSMATTARKSLKIGMIPADGIGREVLPVCLRLNFCCTCHFLNSTKGAKAAIQALGSSIPTTEFIDLQAGFECFQRTGTALPDETVDILKNECDCALFGAVRYSFVSGTLHKTVQMPGVLALPRARFLAIHRLS